MKVAAKDIVPGAEVKLGRGKTAIVRSVTVVELPVQRTVETAIITLVDEDEDGDPKFTDIHVRANKKMEVTPPSKWDRLKAMFKKDKPKENDEKIVDAVAAPPSLPFFVKKPSS